MGIHDRYRYSVTIHSDDLAVVYCLRALSKFSQKTGNNQIPWGGTTDDAWRSSEHRVRFHFDDPKYRDDFRFEGNRLLGGMWLEVDYSDSIPAQRRS